MKASEDFKSSLIAPCGIYCGVCYAHLREKNKCFGCRTDFDTTDLGTLQAVSLTLYDASGNSSICHVFITVLDTITSSVDDDIRYDKNFEFIINPNPSDGIINIESKSAVQDCMLEIYNFSGVLLLKKNLLGGKTELDISDFRQGIYILKVTGKEGREYRDKIIIR